MNYAISFRFIFVFDFHFLLNPKWKKQKKCEKKICSWVNTHFLPTTLSFHPSCCCDGMCVCYFAHSKFRQIPVFISFREMKDARYAHFAYADVVSLYHFLIACVALRTRIYVIVCVLYTVYIYMYCLVWYVLWLTLYSSSLLALALIWIC